MRVVFAGHQASLGGAQNILQSLVSALSSLDIEAIAVFPEEGDAAVAAREAGIETHLLPSSCWMFVNAEAPQSLSCSQFLDGLATRVDAWQTKLSELNPDIVVGNTGVMLEPVLAACLARIPWVWHIHEIVASDPFLQRGGIADLMLPVMNLPGGRVIVPAESVAEPLQDHVAEGRLHVVYNGVDMPDDAIPAELPGAPESGGPRLLFCGNLIERKGVTTLFDAMEKVFEKHDGAQLYIAGREYEHSLDDLLKRLNPKWHDRVVFLGFRRDIPALLRAVDLCIIPSYGDPFPVVTLEAMAAGVPVIGTRSGGMQEQIVDGETGRLVEPRDANGLSAAILEVISDPARLKSMGDAGRSRWEAYFTRRQMVEAFHKQLQDHAQAVDWTGHETAGRSVRALLALASARADEGAWLQAQFERLCGVEAEYRALLNRWPVSWLRALKRLVGGDKTTSESGPESEIGTV